jgi:hypothetical protein
MIKVHKIYLILVYGMLAERKIEEFFPLEYAPEVAKLR